MLTLASDPFTISEKPVLLFKPELILRLFLLKQFNRSFSLLTIRCRQTERQLQFSVVC